MKKYKIKNGIIKKGQVAIVHGAIDMAVLAKKIGKLLFSWKMDDILITDSKNEIHLNKTTDKNSD